MNIHKITNLAFGFILIIYTLYSFFTTNDKDIKIIMPFIILLIMSVSLEKKIKTKN